MLLIFELHHMISSYSDLSMSFGPLNVPKAYFL